MEPNILPKKPVERIAIRWSSAGRPVGTGYRSTATTSLSPKRLPACTAFDRYFNLLPRELKILIIDFALSDKLAKPATVFVTFTDRLPTQTHTPPLTALFHVNRFFRYEALQISHRKGCLVPLLAAYRSTQFGDKWDRHPAVRPCANWILRTFAPPIGQFLSKKLRPEKYPGRHLFDADTSLLEIDLTESAFWFNAFLRLSPAMLGQVKYLQIVMKDLYLIPQIPSWQYVLYQMDIDRLPSLMPNLKLVVMKRHDSRVNAEQLDQFRSEWCLRNQYCRWSSWGVWMMPVEGGVLQTRREDSYRAMNEHWIRWRDWVRCNEGIKAQRRVQ